MCLHVCVSAFRVSWMYPRVIAAPLIILPRASVSCCPLHPFPHKLISLCLHLMLVRSSARLSVRSSVRIANECVHILLANGVATVAVFTNNLRLPSMLLPTLLLSLWCALLSLPFSFALLLSAVVFLLLWWVKIIMSQHFKDVEHVSRLWFHRCSCSCCCCWTVSHWQNTRKLTVISCNALRALQFCAFVVFVFFCSRSHVSNVLNVFRYIEFLFLLFSLLFFCLLSF